MQLHLQYIDEYNRLSMEMFLKDKFSVVVVLVVVFVRKENETLKWSVRIRDQLLLFDFISFNLH